MIFISVSSVVVSAPTSFRCASTALGSLRSLELNGSTSRYEMINMNKYELSHIRYWFLFVGLCLTAGQCLQAQIALDGTIGPSGPLTGPNYQIGAELGKQVGGNLFHSFKDFSLNSGEAATFSGPATVQNIISRVTGGNASSIDGAIRSTIPDSNFYLLNPAGVMFGPNASVDVGGSFTASTVDSVKLGAGGKFDARAPVASVLTSAPVEAFGFLGLNVAGIKIQGSKLRVNEGEAISLVGGILKWRVAKSGLPGAT